MPTYNRRAFVPRALEYFLRQDYTNKELVIVDDGMDAIGDLVPQDERFRYLRLKEKITVGAKRNRAIEAARGDIICHWDDDDWHAPRRLSYQVEALLREQAEVCGLRQMLFYDPAADQTWLYTYPETQRPWLAGGSLLYTREFWRRAPFPHVQVGEDSRFVWAHDLRHAVALPDYTFYVALIHPGNTSRKHTRGAYWKSAARAEVQRLLGDDLASYQAISPGRQTRPDQAIGARANVTTQSYKHLPAQASRVTVSIPFHGPPHLLRRAVESILRQTYTNLRIVVINDGDDPPWRHLAHLADPRLICFDLPINRGRYFADAVVLNATVDPYFLVQDADDWSDPRRVEKLLRQLRAEHAVGVISAQQHHTPDARAKVGVRHAVGDLRQPLDAAFKHRADHHGLFRVDALQAMGGYYHGFPIGSDTLIMNFLLMIGSLARVDEPLYHRLIRPDSLTNSPATGMRALLRREVTEQLRQMYAVAFRAYTQYLAGEIEPDILCERLREISQRHVTPEEARTLEAESQKLRAVITSPASQPASFSPGSVLPRPAGAPLDEHSLEWSEWAISRSLAHKLSAYLERKKPRRILETGSGVSTVLFADYARRYQAVVISLEHDPHYYARTQAMLRQTELQDHVDLRLAPLRPLACPDGMSYPWYDAALQGPFDFVLLDGPPERLGRQAALFAVAPHLATEWVMWLDDGARAHEQKCIDLWNQHFQFAQVFDYTEVKGAFYLRSATAASDRLPSQAPPRSTLGISLLTGERLPLLQRTVEGLRTFNNGFLLRNSTIVVMVNGDDAETQAYVEQLPFVAVCVRHTGSALPVGTATSQLMDFLAQQLGVGYILHLEDDWVADPSAPDWLTEAHRILGEYPRVGQVRLRHSQEKVLPYHMITHQPIRWQMQGRFLLSPSAHFTFNPSLVRAQDVPSVFPCQTESEAQKHYLTNGWASAQLVPGVFLHIGAQQSRRTRLGQRL